MEDLSCYAMFGQPDHPKQKSSNGLSGGINYPPRMLNFGRLKPLGLTNTVPQESNQHDKTETPVEIIRINDDKKIPQQDIINMNEVTPEPSLLKSSSSVLNQSFAGPILVETQLPIELSIDDINTSFKVVGELSVGTKLRVVGNRCLAAECSSFSSLGRYYACQGREQVIKFLDHLFNETVRNMNKLLDDIRNHINTDDNINALTGMIYKLGIFLHHFENVRNVYKADSNVYARLDNIRDNFFNFRTTFFRKLILGSMSCDK